MWEPIGSRLHPEIIFGPGVRKNPEFLVLQRPYSAFLGKATTGTCSDLAFCRSEARHYRVHMVHVASAGSHYQTLGGAGVDLPSVVTQAPDFTAFHVWISICNVLPDFCSFSPYISQYFCNYTMCSMYCVARSVLIHVLFTCGTLGTPICLRLYRDFR